MKNDTELEEEVLDAFGSGHEFVPIPDVPVGQGICKRCGMVEGAVPWKAPGNYPKTQWKTKCLSARRLPTKFRRMIAVGPWDEIKSKLSSDDWLKAWVYLRDTYGTH